MGWLRTIFLGDVGNRLDIGDNEERIRRIRRNLRRKSGVDREQSQQIGDLQERCDYLETSFEILTQLLVERGHLPEDELRHLLEVAAEPAPEGGD
ncbi:MAG: hypothetical protein AAF196_07935 [Planctomycetota bacterium]